LLACENPTFGNESAAIKELQAAVALRTGDPAFCKTPHVSMHSALNLLSYCLAAFDQGGSKPGLGRPRMGPTEHGEPTTLAASHDEFGGWLHLREAKLEHN
jgi:hypothetical protein